jgi:hypothetical protein
MANQEHLRILRQGVKAWNQWREQHADVRPDLRGANLSGAILHSTNLREASLHAADLRDANLSQGRPRWG